MPLSAMSAKEPEFWRVFPAPGRSGMTPGKTLSLYPPSVVVAGVPSSSSLLFLLKPLILSLNKNMIYSKSC